MLKKVGVLEQKALDITETNMIRDRIQWPEQENIDQRKLDTKAITSN